MCDAVRNGIEVAMHRHAHLLEWQRQLHHDGRLNIDRHAHPDGSSGRFDTFGILLIHSGHDALYALQELSHFSENLIALSGG